MKILVSFPGRAGDLLWALPALRALSRRIDTQIDLQICGEFAGLVPLLRLQPYLRYVHADPRWNMSEGWQAPPLDTGGYYDQIFHLGYRRWPELDLARETLHTLNELRAHDGESASITAADLDLSTSWITIPNTAPDDFGGVTVGFAETHVELKMGLLFALGNHGTGWINVLVMPGGRIEQEWMGPCAVDYNLHTYESTWENAAWYIGNSRVFLGCCSGLHVLAVAMGIPVILYEPMEARWNPIFYPLGWDGPQVTIVKGNDGRPTVDARHTADAIHAKRTQLQESHT